MKKMLVFLFGCAVFVFSASMAFAGAPVLIGADELEALVGKPDVKVIDLRGMMGYRTGHVPGAINVGMADFDDAGAKFKFVRATKEQFEAAAGKLGIKPTDTVVFVDAAKTTAPFRVWWVFRSYGHQGRLAILDGGMETWKGKTEILAPDITPSEYKTPGSDPKTIATIDEVAGKLGDKGAVILDVRAPDEYAGTNVMSGSGKGGRIPGAVLVPHAKAFGADGKLLPADQLKKIYEDAGVTPDKEIFVYCQGGVRAAVSTFVLSEVLGYPNVKNYDGAWLEWSNSDKPFEKD